MQGLGRVLSEQRIHTDLDILKRYQSRRTLSCPVVVALHSASLGFKLQIDPV